MIKEKADERAEEKRLIPQLNRISKGMNVESPENKGVDSSRKMASGSTFTISSKYLKTEREGGRVKESHSLGFLKTKLLWKPF